MYLMFVQRIILIENCIPYSQPHQSADSCSNFSVMGKSESPVPCKLTCLGLANYLKLSLLHANIFWEWGNVRLWPPDGSRYCLWRSPAVWCPVSSEARMKDSSIREKKAIFFNKSLLSLNKTKYLRQTWTRPESDLRKMKEAKKSKDLNA